jgi:hypothetical protein
MKRLHLRRPSVLLVLVAILVAIVGIASGSAEADTILVPSGSAWRYLDDGSDQGTAWRESAFADSSWLEGPAQLGYGDGDEATVVGYGPDPNSKYVTTYFRHTFDVPDPSQYVCLLLKVMRDDGAVVYLNGQEITRSNMPGGVIGYLTFAASTVSGDDEDAFFEAYLDPSYLSTGTNVLAAEIHQTSRTSSDISFDLELSGSAELPPLMAKGPYLIFAGDNTRMQVHWQLIWTETSTIQWGTDTTYSLGSEVTTEYGADHQHTCTIDGLEPGVKHYYRVIVGDTTYTGSFFAAPPGDAVATKFLAYGDTRTYPADHDIVAGAIVSAYQSDPALQSVVLSVGDLVSDGDVESDWDTEFFDAAYANIQTMLANVPYQAAMGNHEGSGVLFTKYFPYPFVGGRYWSFDYGPAHFAVVDQYTSYGPGSAQLTWLEADLASTAKPWKFIYLHEPGWSAGNHPNNTAVQNYIQPLCETYGVPVIFAGHNHYYARAVVNNVHHITTGGGGAPLYDPDPGYPNVVATAKAYHYCKVEVEGGVMEFQAFAYTGALIDSFTVCLPGAGIDPPGGDAPSGGVMLNQMHPNPSRGECRITFAIPHAMDVHLGVYDIMGKKTRILVERVLGPGRHSLLWDGKDTLGRPVTSGIYLCQLKAGGSTITNKVVIAD